MRHLLYPFPINFVVSCVREWLSSHALRETPPVSHLTLLRFCVRKWLSSNSLREEPFRYNSVKRFQTQIGKNYRPGNSRWKPHNQVRAFIGNVCFAVVHGQHAYFFAPLTVNVKPRTTPSGSYAPPQGRVGFSVTSPLLRTILQEEARANST